MTDDARGTRTVMVATAISRVLGFVRIAVVGAIFGARGDADVLNLVFTIPNNLRKLLAEGALSSAFVPVITGAARGDATHQRPRALVRSLLGLQLIVLTPVIAAGVIFAGPTVAVLFSFSETAQMDLAVHLFRVLLPYALFMSLAAVAMGALNAYRAFAVPAVVPLWFSISVIGTTIAFHRQLGVFAMAAGVLIGGVGQFIFQLPALRRVGLLGWPTLDTANPDLRRVLRRWGPVLATSSVFAISQQVASLFASGLAPGSGSALTNAIVFWQLPFGIFGASITTVLFTGMSEAVARNDYDALGRIVERGIGALALIMVPAGVGLAILGPEIVGFALQRGAFDATATALTARVLAGYGIGLFSVSAFTFSQRLFYALSDVRTPLAIAIVVVTIDITLSLILKESVLGVVGLAVANSIAFTVGLALIVRATRRRIGAFSPAALRLPLGRAVLSTAFAATAAVATRQLLAALGVYAAWNGGANATGVAILASSATAAALGLSLGYRVTGTRLRDVLRYRSLQDDTVTDDA